MSERTYALLKEAWIPVRRQSGVRQWIAPHQITSKNETDPVKGPDWGRADFDAATFEFLIGLLATACPPNGISDWKQRYDNAPTPEALAAAFAPLADAFWLDGNGPRFMQEIDQLDVSPSPVSSLFIEAPGANTEKNNADLFQKRGRIEMLGMPAAAIALFTLQTYAPSGGAGHRTSIRGSGPLTTLGVPPSAQDTLWHRAWLNVPEFEMPMPLALERIFPWLAPTVTSEGKRPPIGPDDIDPRGVFWGMPRRIRLDVETLPTPSQCSLFGVQTGVAVATYRTRPWGMNYGPLEHPLSPMYRQKVTSTEWLYVHPQPGSLTYRHWIDMAAEDMGTSALRRPASAVSTARRRLEALRSGNGRLWAAGYDMDNMKARGFVEATFPLFALVSNNDTSSKMANERLDASARKWVEAANEVASLTIGAAKHALAADSSDSSQLGSIREDYFARTQTLFFQLLRAVGDALTRDPEDAETGGKNTEAFFAQALRPAALVMFDQHVPLLRPSAREAERIVAARLSLISALGGYGKRGQALYEKLGLAPSAAKSAGQKNGKRERTA
jgi:CRISPR system Cascade subunit CasA